MRTLCQGLLLVAGCLGTADVVATADAPGEGDMGEYTLGSAETHCQPIPPPTMAEIAAWEASLPPSPSGQCIEYVLRWGDYAGPTCGRVAAVYEECTP